ncbi:MAG: hypothetical protein KC635_06445 [Myxococcales bacterium]|nr:hypothetical protein [Myxococcales bacterium]MCB9731819.1 hypothetical protein [Deltaproteobacteria bacterium]
MTPLAQLAAMPPAFAQPEPAFQVSATGLIFFLAIGLGLFALMRGLHYLLEVSRLPKRRKAAFGTGLTIFETVLALGYVVSAVPMVFSGRSEYTPYYALLMAVALLWIGWIAARDLVHGIFFKAGRACRVGEQVALELGGGEPVRGRVSRLGYRALALVTSRGQEVLIPYSQLTRRTVVREPTSAGAVRHTFRLAPPPGVSLGRVTEAAKLAAFNCHWASASREMQIELVDGGALELGVYALDALHGPDVEAAVRGAVTALR